MKSLSSTARTAVFGWLVFAAAGWVPATGRAAGLSIAPTRVILEGNARVASVQLANKSDTPLTYRILLKDKRMLENGRIVDVTDGARPGERLAADLLRYAPRRVVVPPHGSQTIRLMLKQSGDPRLAEGEYRTHLVLRSLPPAGPDADGHVRARAIIETSIPVIIRRGHFDAAIALRDAALDSVPARDGRRHLQVTLERQGERSVYGNLVVVLRQDGHERVVARMNGLAVYCPTPRRRLSVPLNVPADLALDSGTLLVRFQEDPTGGGGHLSAETTLVLDRRPGA